MTSSRSSVRKSRRASTPALAVGCDLGGTNLKVALVRERTLVKTETRAVEHSPPAANEAARSAAISAQIGDAVRDVLRDSGELSPPPPLCVAVPGLLGSKRRVVLEVSKFPELKGFKLAESLERRLRGLVAPRVLLDADTNAGAYGVARLSRPRPDRLLYVSIGTGLGAALVAGGEIVRASHHTVGQIAHLPLVPDGPQCSCGSRGCAEVVLNARSLRVRARNARLRGDIAESAETLHAAAVGGHPGARAVFSDFGERLGELLVILARLFSPDGIVVGGGVAGAADLFLSAAQRVVASRYLGRNALDVQSSIGATQLGPHAGAIGAALLAREFSRI